MKFTELNQDTLTQEQLIGLSSAHSQRYHKLQQLEDAYSELVIEIQEMKNTLGSKEELRAAHMLLQEIDALNDFKLGYISQNRDYDKNGNSYSSIRVVQHYAILLKNGTVFKGALKGKSWE